MPRMYQEWIKWQKLTWKQATWIALMATIDKKFLSPLVDEDKYIAWLKEIHLYPEGE